MSNGKNKLQNVVLPAVLYWCENSSRFLGQEHGFIMYHNAGLMRYFGSQKGKEKV
jgi:hypothetical protein